MPAFFRTAPLTERLDHGRELRGSVDGVTFELTRRWWGRRWLAASESRLSVPDPMLVFVSRRGMDHGFWRDFRVGDATFDRQHFVYSDTPALLPIVIGPATRAAIAADVPIDDAVTLYLSDGICRVAGINDHDDETAIPRHLAVHRGLRADLQTFLDDWRALVTSVQGRAEAIWPPVGTVITPVGGLRAYVRWIPASRRDPDWERREDSLRTVVAGSDGRSSKIWAVREAEHGRDEDFEVRGQRYWIEGRPPVGRAVLEQIAERSGFASLTAKGEVRIAVRGIATSNQLGEMVRAIQQLLDPAQSGSPYR